MEILKKINYKILLASSIILTSLIVICLYLRIPLKLISKSQYTINNIKLSRIRRSANCNIKTINRIPFGSTIVIGHLYGSPSNHNNFINMNMNNDLPENDLPENNKFKQKDFQIY